MRSFKHWTPRYVYHRLGLMVYERLHPNAPWLVRTTVELLDSWLRPDDRGLEWGSGRSTAWFAQRVKTLVSIEHDTAWYAWVTKDLQRKGLSNVDYRLCQDENYYRSADEFPSESLDFCLVDGIERDHCALAAISIVKPGGLIIVDNCNWYLPSNSCSPYSLREKQAPHTPRWGMYLEGVAEWRKIWMSNGVCDTALWVKPTPLDQRNERADLLEQILSSR